MCPNATCRARAHRVVCCNYRSASLWGFFGRVYSFERALAELLWKVKQGGTLEVCSATKASQSLCERSERTPFRSQLRVGAPLRLQSLSQGNHILLVFADFVQAFFFLSFQLLSCCG